jgi:hypothetical protein
LLPHEPPQSHWRIVAPELSGRQNPLTIKSTKEHEGKLLMIDPSCDFVSFVVPEFLEYDLTMAARLATIES